MRDDVLVGHQIGGFLVESLIGRGGMSRVYLAQQLSLDRRVALKILSGELSADADFRARFLREARLASSLEHPNILPVYDAGEHEGLLFMAMRYVDGSDLAAQIAAHGPMSPEQALHYIAQAASALDAAHAVGLVHRDVKPANMLLSGQHLYLTDFGIAKAVTARRDLTRTGMFVGTLDYAAPEQIRNEPLDGRADMYSLGCVLFQCLTGQVPYDRPSEYGVMQAHLTEPVPSLRLQRPDVATSVDEVIAVALAKEPDARYRSGRHFVEALRSALLPSNTSATRIVEAPSLRSTVAAPLPIPVATPKQEVESSVQRIVPVARSTTRRVRPPLMVGGALAVALASVVVVRAAFAGTPSPSPTPTLAATAQSTTAATAAAAAPREIIIATDFPVSGNDRASGRGPEAGAQYAITQAGSIRGFKITYKSYDDAVNGVHDPQQGAKNVTDMANNPAILAVVGPFNSNVSRAELPIANRAGLALISPANTNECLTRDYQYCDPKASALRPTGANNYFRISAPDTVQGPAMADFAVDRLGVTRVAAFSDSETFGSLTANGFCSRLAARGGQCVVRQDFKWQTTSDFTGFLSRAQAAGAQAVYAGATSATKGCVVRAQMKGYFSVATPFLGNDGIGDSQCVSDARDMAPNMYFSNAAADGSQDPANSQLIAAFRRAFTGPDDWAAYTLPGYDCARIAIDAIARAIDKANGQMPTRQQVVAALSETRELKLTTGTYSFDQYGDPVSPTMAFYRLTGSSWMFVAQMATRQ